MSTKRATIFCQPCGARFDSVTFEIAKFRYRDHACVPIAIDEIVAPLDIIDDAADLAADYLERLRRVDRVLEGGVHNPAHFIAKIRAAIGVLPPPEETHAAMG